MGAENKLLADLDGRPVLGHVLEVATGAPFVETVVVTGHDHAFVLEVAQRLGVRTIHNERWSDGMGTSLATAAADLEGAGLDGLAVLLGDVPLVHPVTLARLAEAWSKAPAPAIARPVWRGRPGHPVILASAFLPDLLALEDDRGAQAVLRAHADRVLEVDTDDEGVTLDADTPGALAELRRRVAAGRPRGWEERCRETPDTSPTPFPFRLPISMTTVTTAQATTILDAAQKKSEDMGVKMNIAVVDAGANLLAFRRMDGAWLGSVDIAIKKAKTARFFDMPTGDIGGLSQPGGSLYGIEHSNGGLISFPGGIPLMDGDEVIGAIGVSGSTVEDDHAVAQAGVDAL